MPIQAKNKSLYPKDWPAISQRIRFERAGNRCEWCQAENKQPHPVTGGMVTLTVAHLNHNPSDCRDENLAALCNQCHNAYDRQYRNFNRWLNQTTKQLNVALLPARVPSSMWHIYGDDGPAMVRLFAELGIDDDKHPSLWRLPLWVTGCQNASEMDRQGWVYDDVLRLCKAVVAQKKWECRRVIRQAENIIPFTYRLPAPKSRKVIRMTDKPILFDGCCGQGGTTKGYQDAGFYVVGMDIEPQPRYCGDEFIQGDVIEHLAKHGHKYDAIHVSPPCQTHTQLNKIRKIKASTEVNYVDLIPQLRALLESIGKLWVMENVVGAPLINPTMLCGSMFGLKVYRHRLFESPLLILAPPHTPHRDNTPAAGSGVSDKGFVSITSGGIKNLPEGWTPAAYKNMAMGIDWMTQKGLTEAVPPAFTLHIGRQLMKALGFWDIPKAA